jgi:mono/diheme cytochrome c family protein
MLEPRTALTVLLALVPFAAASAAEPAKSGNAVERGAYLATIGGCHDCHTPFKLGPKGPEPDMTKMLSGHPEGLLMPDPPAPKGPWIWSGASTNTAFAGPWGVSYAVNLTPDKETGIPGFTEERFIQSMRNGRHLGMGRAILPPMPWPNVGQMTDEDLKALHAFLRSVPPVKNRVPDAKPAPPPAAAPAGRK